MKRWLYENYRSWKRYGFDKVFDYVAKDPQKRGYN